MIESGQDRTTISIVSHGQGKLVQALLRDLCTLEMANTAVIVTLNIPEDETFLEAGRTLRLHVIRNDRPKGFGANHNSAFRLSEGDIFVVANPDIRLPSNPLSALRATLALPNVGASVPVVLSPAGTTEDSVRRFPTPGRLFRRVVLRRRHPDYEWDLDPITIDWGAGMFMVFRHDAFAAVGGFDEQYFMYLEDTDICRRLTRNGWLVMLQPRAQVVHEARRSSRRNWQHMRWHLASMTRFLASG